MWSGPQTGCGVEALATAMAPMTTTTTTMTMMRKRSWLAEFGWDQTCRQCSGCGFPAKLGGYRRLLPSVFWCLCVSRLQPLLRCCESKTVLAHPGPKNFAGETHAVILGIVTNVVIFNWETMSGRPFTILRYGFAHLLNGNSTKPAIVFSPLLDAIILLAGGIMLLLPFDARVFLSW